MVPNDFCVDWNLLHDGNSSHASQPIMQQQQRPHLSMLQTQNLEIVKLRPACGNFLSQSTFSCPLAGSKAERRDSAIWSSWQLTERESELCKISPLLAVQKIDMSGEVGATSEETHHQVPIFLPSSLIKSDVIRKKKHLVVADASSFLSTSGPTKVLLR